MSQSYSVDPQRRRSSLGIFIKSVHVQLHGKGRGQTLAVSFSAQTIFPILGFACLLPFLFPLSTVLIIGTLLAMGAVVVNFLTTWDPIWDLKTALRQYVVVQIFSLVGMYKSWQYHQDSKHVRDTQENTLLRILNLNISTAYARDNNFSSIRTSADYKRTQPLTKFINIKPYVERMKNGEANALTADPPLYFAKTSGTTGEPAFLPYTKTMKNQQLTSLAFFEFNANRHIQWSNLHRLRPVWRVGYIPPKVMETTACGVLAGPMSANPMWTKVGEIFTAPTAAFRIEDLSTGGYVQLVFALRYRQLGAIEGFFASLVYYAFKKMETEWRDLVEDIRRGSLRENLDISQELRKKLNSYLKPDPARADELEEEFQKGFDNIASRIWPELEIINCITTGPFSIYGQYLKNHYTKDILLYSTCLGASEEITGINFWPFIQPNRYTLLPRLIFYEFIPVDEIQDENPTTLLIDQVKFGQEYEMVITTVAGLYRYRIGDVVKIVSYYNQCPVFEFLHRAGGNLNIKAEKVSELSIYAALAEAVKLTTPQLELVDYTSCESVLLDLVHAEDENQPSPHHVVFIELHSKEDVDQREFAQRLAVKYDELMQRDHYKYKEVRGTNSLGHAVIKPLKSGAFARLREHMLKTSSTSPQQLKIPRVLLKKTLLNFVLSERI